MHKTPSDYFRRIGQQQTKNRSAFSLFDTVVNYTTWWPISRLMRIRATMLLLGDVDQVRHP